MDLGAPVCRILVPGYSEVYPVEDLVWDNTVWSELTILELKLLIEIALDDDLDFNDYHRNLTRMFGEETMRQVIGAVNDEIRFPGLTPTSMGLEGIDRHQRLIESYRKLHAARAAGAAEQA